MSSLQQGNASLITSATQTVLIFFFFVVCLNITVDLLTYSQFTDSIDPHFVGNHVNQSRLQLLSKSSVLLPATNQPHSFSGCPLSFFYSHNYHTFPPRPIIARNLFPFRHSSLPLRVNSLLLCIQFFLTQPALLPNHSPLPLTSTLSLKTLKTL